MVSVNQVSMRGQRVGGVMGRGEEGEGEGEWRGDATHCGGVL